MLWHAIGIKYAGRLTGNISDHGRSLYKNKEVSYYDILICSSDIDRYYTASFQGVDVEKVHVTGLPKADNYILMRERYEDQRLLHGGIINILYAPTFRDFPIDRPLFFPFGDFTVEALSAMLEEFANVRLFLRAHPNDLHSLEYAAELQARLPGVIKNISFDVLDDIDEVLHQFDVIITDYSSIYMEPLLHDIPVIFVNHDFDQYVKTRGLAYPYDIVTPGPKVKTFKGFRQEVAEAIEGAPRWRAQRAAVREMFFKHKDNGSCERISRLIS